MSDIWAWLHDADWKTWLGHGLQGVAITAVADLSSLGLAAGVYTVLVHFALREAPGLIIAAKAGKTDKLVDGVFDLLAPVAGIALWVLGVSLL